MIQVKGRRFSSVRAGTVLRGIVIAAVASAIWTGPTAAYWGNSFMAIPGMTGDWKGADHKGWIRIVSNQWRNSGSFLGGARGRGGCAVEEYRNCHSGPSAPRQGASALAIAIDKRSPVLPALMDACLKRTPIAEATFAEASERIRRPREVGPRPADVPEYFEYTLKDVSLSDCTLVANAPEQAFVLNFKDIQWLNYKGDAKGSPTTPVPAALPPVKSSGTTKAFVLEWFGLAHDAADDQCPAMNSKPGEKEFLAFLPAEEAAKERANLERGGREHPNRGPNRLSVTALPGIVPDPGNAEPQTKLAIGLNLDGDDGTGAAPAGVCKHKNYVSADGRTGIDNQLFAVQGCTAGYLGRKGKGFGMELMNASRRDGRQKAAAMLIEISGIDNERNDASVDVTVLYSEDRMIKNADGKLILPDYSFRVSDKPEYTSYFARLPGRIVNGVVVTEALKALRFTMDAFPDYQLYDARMRLEFMPDGSMSGIIGGYQNWRYMMGMDPMLEGLWGFQAPGFYNAFKRAADGLKDPVTGECTGVSSAFEIYGVPAFITHGQRTMQVSQVKVGN